VGRSKLIKLNDRHVSALVKLGLSPNQAKVYLALVMLGPVPAKSIWVLVKINREEVYRKLNDLIKMGFVERVFTNPSTFRAVPLESTTSTLLKRKAVTLSNLKVDVDKVIENLTNKNGKNKKLADQASIILIPEKRPIYERAKSELETVQQSLDTICSWKKGVSWLKSHQEHFLNALDRKVKIRFILDKNAGDSWPSSLLEILHHNNFHEKLVNVLPPTCIGLYDKKRLLIDTSTKSSFIETPCLWSDYPSIVGMAQIYFDTIWNS
jgi:sugar-specific transcriptional regulator TrmB